MTAKNKPKKTVIHARACISHVPKGVKSTSPETTSNAPHPAKTLPPILPILNCMVQR